MSEILSPFDRETADAILTAAPTGTQFFRKQLNMYCFLKLESHFVYAASTVIKGSLGGKVKWTLVGCRSVVKIQTEDFFKISELREDVADHIGRGH